MKAGRRRLGGWTGGPNTGGTLWGQFAQMVGVVAGGRPRKGHCPAPTSFVSSPFHPSDPKRVAWSRRSGHARWPSPYGSRQWLGDDPRGAKMTALPTFPEVHGGSRRRGKASSSRHMVRYSSHRLSGGISWVWSSSTTSESWPPCLLYSLHTESTVRLQRALASHPHTPREKSAAITFAAFTPPILVGKVSHEVLPGRSIVMLSATTKQTELDIGSSQTARQGVGFGSQRVA